MRNQSSTHRVLGSIFQNLLVRNTSHNQIVLEVILIDRVWLFNLPPTQIAVWHRPHPLLPSLEWISDRLANCPNDYGAVFPQETYYRPLIHTQAMSYCGINIPPLFQNLMNGDGMA